MMAQRDKTMTRTGRPTKCTRALTERFAHLMRGGHYLSTVADLVGVSRRSAHRWLRRGEEALLEAQESGEEIPPAEEPYVNFRLKVKRAAAEAVMRSVEIIQEAAGADGDGDWRAAKWFLEKRCPHTWGAKRKTLEHTGAGGGPIRHGPSWFDAVAEECEEPGLKLQITRPSEGGGNGEARRELVERLTQAKDRTESEVGKRGQSSK